MQCYIGCEIIQADVMDENKFLELYMHEEPQGETREGYHVRDSNGYDSWLPKEVFKNTYRLIATEEKRLIQNSPA